MCSWGPVAQAGLVEAGAVHIATIVTVVTIVTIVMIATILTIARVTSAPPPLPGWLCGLGR